MRKLLGTIAVYQDDSSLDISCCSPVIEGKLPLDQWPTKFEIVLTPHGSDEVTKGLTALSDRDKLRTILCHELGHAVGFLMHDPTQHPMYRLLNDTGTLDGEKVAWDNASLMGQDIDPTIQRRCLQTYLDNQAEESNDPILRMLRDVSREAAIELGHSNWVKRSHVPSMRTGDALDRAWNIATDDTFKGLLARLAIPTVVLILALACGAHASVKPVTRVGIPSTAGLHKGIDIGTVHDVMHWGQRRAIPALGRFFRKGGK